MKFKLTLLLMNIRADNAIHKLMDHQHFQVIVHPSIIQ